jgi:hypothetical protein
MFKVAIQATPNKAVAATIGDNDLVFLRSNIPNVGRGIVILREVATNTGTGFDLLPLWISQLDGEAPSRYEPFIKIPDGDAVERSIHAVFGMCGIDLIECGEDRFRVVMRKDEGMSVTLTPPSEPSKSEVGKVGESIDPPTVPTIPITDRGAVVPTLVTPKDQSLKRNTVFGGPAFGPSLGRVPSY